MNYLQGLGTLKNQYFILRHGESTANIDNVIVSTANHGVPAYGLSHAGIEQVKQSVRADNNRLENCLIVSSDFKRARQTASLAHEGLRCTNDITLNINLRERDFGDFEMRNNKHYDTVWSNDYKDSGHTQYNVESANAVTQRVTALILYLELQFKQKTILLVSHGDTLQLLQTAFLKQSAGNHRQQKHLQTAEIRALTLLNVTDK